MPDDAPPPDSPPPANDAPAAPWYAAAYDPAKPGEFAPDWLTKVPPTEAEMWQEYKDAKNPIDALMAERQRRTDAQTALRTKADKAAGLPPKPEGEAATPEAWKAYREARGLPADTTGYGLVKPEGYPDALWNQAETDEAAALFLDLELKPDQVKALTKWYQERGLQSQAAFDAEMATRAAAQEKAKADYIQSQKETLHQNHGINVDKELRVMEKLLSTALPADRVKQLLDPDQPDHFIGAELVKGIASIVAMHPKSGDPTARMLGNVGGSQSKDRAYFQNLKAGDPDLKALKDRTDPRHAQVVAEKQAAYERDAALTGR